jgi:hypothetical protein
MLMMIERDYLLWKESLQVSLTVTVAIKVQCVFDRFMRIQFLLLFEIFFIPENGIVFAKCRLALGASS